MVAQGTYITLGSSAPAANAGYGEVDRFQGWVTGTTLSSGSFQSTSPYFTYMGAGGHGIGFLNVTVTGAGVVHLRHRIEAHDSKRFKNRTASLSAVVKHTVGSAINYTCIIRKANSADSFSAVTTIATSSATSVPDSTETQIRFENVSMGDCSTGIEIEITADCGAVTTKHFGFTEIQLEEGAEATSFEYRDYASELVKCLRYREIVSQYGEGALGVFSAYTSNQILGGTQFKQKKRASPTVTMYGSNIYWYYNGSSYVSAAIPTADYVNEYGFRIFGTITGMSATAGGIVIPSSGYGYTASAEL